jgi:hypothetical protein
MLLQNTTKEQYDKIAKILFNIMFSLDENQSKLAPLSAFIGGVVSQEILKAIT